MTKGMTWSMRFPVAFPFASLPPLPLSTSPPPSTNPNIHSKRMEQSTIRTNFGPVSQTLNNNSGCISVQCWIIFDGKHRIRGGGGYDSHWVALTNLIRSFSYVGILININHKVQNWELRFIKRMNCDYRGAVKLGEAFLHVHVAQLKLQRSPFAEVKVPNQTQRHEDVWGNEVIAPPFLTSAVDRGERSASRQCCITHGETVTGTHVIGHGWIPEPVRTLEKNLAPVGNRTPFPRPSSP
jgi:hypothetical protein